MQAANNLKSKKFIKQRKEREICRYKISIHRKQQNTVEKIKELKKWIALLYSLVRTLLTIKISILPKLTCTFDDIQPQP